MKKLKAFKLKKKVWVIAAAFIFVIPSSVFAFNKGYSHFQVKQIVEQAKILSAAGKYDEAISVLLLAENKWATKSLKGEVVSELEKNRDFEEQAPDATESGIVTESPSPSPTQKIVKSESKQVPSPSLLPSSAPTIASYSPSPTIPERKKVPVYLKSIKVTYYCDEEGVSQVTAADALFMLHEENLKLCFWTVNYVLNDCNNLCDVGNACGSWDFGFCDYEGQLACRGECSSPYQNGLDECVNKDKAEQDRQIKNLDEKVSQYCY